MFMSSEHRNYSTFPLLLSPLPFTKNTHASLLQKHPLASPFAFLHHIYPNLKCALKKTTYQLLISSTSLAGCLKNIGIWPDYLFRGSHCWAQSSNPPSWNQLVIKLIKHRSLMNFHMHDHPRRN